MLCFYGIIVFFCITEVMGMSAPIRILLTDSDPKKLRRYGRMTLWGELGFKVTDTACTTQDALDILDDMSFGLAVLVSRPPETDAETLLQRCKELDIPALVILPRKNGESVGHYFGLGACDVIVEPPSRSRLRHALLKAQRMICKGTGAEYRRAAETAFASLEKRSISSEFMMKLKAFIESCEGETATTCSAAEYFSFNKDYFGKLFKQETGMTFNSFYNGFRIEYAKELLTSGRYRINEISELLGFSSVDYFTGVFKRQTGCTPSGYRKAAD